LDPIRQTFSRSSNVFLPSDGLEEDLKAKFIHQVQTENFEHTPDKRDKLKPLEYQYTYGTIIYFHTTNNNDYSY